MSAHGVGWAADGWLVGVDVGGTKIAALVVDERRTVRGHAVATTDVSSPEGTLASIVATTEQARTMAGISPQEIRAIGIGIPGRVDAQRGTVHLAVNLNWNAVSAGTHLSQHLQAPCFLENDVRAATLGLRAHTGLPRVDNLAYLSVGTGISAGVILNGRLHQGVNGMAGEVGHVQVASGPRCQCGSMGCLEAVASGTAIAREARAAIEAGAESQLRWVEPITAWHVYQAAAEGDALALGIVTQAGRYLAQALHALIMSYDVECVVVGGGLSRAGDHFWNPVLAGLELRRQESALAREMLAPHKFHLLSAGYDAGTWGAIAVAERGLNQHQPNGHRKEQGQPEA